MHAGEDLLAAPPPAPSNRAPGSAAWPVLLAGAWLASLWGLLAVPLDVYDEPLLLLGGRLMGAGRLPYRDFYTNYGPLGYALISWLPRSANPGIAYRLLQAALLLLLAILFAGLRRVVAPGRRPWLSAGVAAFAYLSLATVLQTPHFLAYASVLASLAMLILADSAPTPRASARCLAAAGVAVAIAALIRPAFGFYAAAATIALSLAVLPLEAALRRIGIAAAAAVASGTLIWFALFRAIPLADAWISAIVIPDRLSSSRFVPPAQPFPALGLAPSATIAAAATASLFALCVLGALSTGNRGARAAGATGTALAASLPFFLGALGSPARIATAGALALLAIAFLTWRLARAALASDARLRASAACGLAAAAFLHYDLARADPAHIVPALALAVASALLALPRLSATGRILTLGLLILAARSPWLGLELAPPASIGRSPGTPSVSTASGFWSRFPASMFPIEAVESVRAADSEADPGSRFVALASDHRRSEGSAAVLFLLSKRLPYTRWYAYDPGVQTAPFVQALMVGELERSGSRSAVVWSARSFGGVERGPDEAPATPLDRRLLELYPRILGQYGGLQVRLGELVVAGR
ncbi:MAG TPA: hypothetical protein VGK26_06055 [Thermoanaerobaculia bacterium]